MERRAIRKDFDDLMHAGKGIRCLMQNSKVSAMDGINGRDSALAIDGKTLRGAIDADGNQAHVLGIVGHDSKASYAQKKSA